MSIDSTCSSKKFNLERATNFMRQFRDPDSRELKKLSANQFMEVWSHYDRDGNGYIEGTELDGFLKEFVSSANFTDISPDMKTILSLVVVAVVAAVGDSLDLVKVSPVEDLESYINEIETRDFSVASRTTRLNVGSVLSGDRVLYSSVLSQEAVTAATRSQEVMFSSSSTITSLLAVEIGTTVSTAVISDGGVGFTNVTVRFTSAAGRAFNFQFIVFGR